MADMQVASGTAMTRMPDATVRVSLCRTLMRRIALECRAAVELWLLPFAVAALPYRAGIALARSLARMLPLYRDATDASAAAWREATGGPDEAAFRAGYRFTQLVDHADLFWVLTRSRRFLRERLAAPRFDAPAGQPLLVLSFHFGQGLWLIDALAAQGHAVRFVSIRLDRGDSPSTLAHAYARLRIAAVARLSGSPLIFTGGARRAIGEALSAGGSVYGLVDVPIPGGSEQVANASLLGRPVLLPTGLLEAAQGRGARALVLTAHVAADGSRVVEASACERIEDIDIAPLADALSRRMATVPTGWHFWYLWHAFRARPVEAAVEPGRRA